MTKKRMNIAFSGGRTSAFMTKYLLDNYSDEYEFVITFANTGQEHENTLRFVHECDVNFGFNTVWLEAVVHHDARKGSTHKIVTYETASRDGQPYEEVIKKYGIANKVYPNCNRELKLCVMRSYLRSIGWGRNTYTTAIGIRADESRRVRATAEEKHIVYPLAQWLPCDKQDINDWWDEQSFKLELPEHLGNCTWCWKKSLKKHIRLVKENPEVFDFPRRMEALYGFNGAPDADGRARVFFRERRSTEDLFVLAAAMDNDQAISGRMDMDANSGCSESCEIFETE